MKLLVIEDDSKIVSAITLAFHVGWPDVKVVSADWGEEGINLVETDSPDAVILDLGLPDMNGLDVIKGIRLFSRVPILVLTVNTDESAVVQALELGATEYIFKPFRQMELLARVKHLLTQRGAADDGGSLIWGPLQYDYSRHEVIYGDKKISLRCTENEVFHVLMTHAPEVVTYSTFAKAVWGDDYTDAVNCLKVHIRHLREKIEDNPSQPHTIITKTGVGYYLAKPTQHTF